MTDLLNPPPEHDLPPDRAADIRSTVMRSTSGSRRRRSPRRRWLLVPAVAVLTVVGALIGLRPVEVPSVVGSPSPAPSAASPSVLDDGAVTTDAGPLHLADAVAAVDKLRARSPGFDSAPLADIVLARRTTTALGDGTYVMWTDTKGSTWWAADVPGVTGTWGPVSGPAVKKPSRAPDAAHPVVRETDLVVFGWRMDADRPDATARDLHAEHFYRVAGSVDRVEVRMTVEGKAGPWFSAPVLDGYAFVLAVTTGPHSTTEHVDKVTKVEDRAFDHDGNPVPIVGH
ncbi:MAG: hypothetical protein ACRYG2_00440 [Janthinobacterium lividum]